MIRRWTRGRGWPPSSPVLSLLLVISVFSLVRNLPPRSQRENDRMLFHDSKNLFLSTRRGKEIKNDPRIFLRRGEEKRIDNWKIGFFLQRKGMDRKSSFGNE